MVSLAPNQVGIDEVGRGAWAGPLVAAAVWFPKKIRVPKSVILRDSKTLTKKQKMCSAQFIREHSVFVIKSVSIQTLSQKCVQEANKIVFEKCVAEMKKKLENFNGEAKFFIDGRPQKNFSHTATYVVGGDGLYQSIAAASIIAKVERDQMMTDLAEAYPQYGFERHVGYGTREHYAALLAHGPCPEHRMSYMPMKKLFASFSPAILKSENLKLET